VQAGKTNPAALTSAEHRRALAREIARTEQALSPAKLPGASPLNRVATRPQVELLRALSDRLLALDRPVTWHGVLELEHLLRSPDSPLYTPAGESEVRAALLSALAALDAAAPRLKAV
jgi:hypothetical protein